MTVKIEFFTDFIESTLPIIRLTKSRNKTTGTATFLFIRPSVFNAMQNKFDCLKTMSLLWDNKSIRTSDITILFSKGRPFLLKSIFVFKNANEWFQFLNFMQHYCNETGVSFTKFQP